MTVRFSPCNGPIFNNNIANRAFACLIKKPFYLAISSSGYGYIVLYEYVVKVLIGVYPPGHRDHPATTEGDKALELGKPSLFCD